MNKFLLTVISGIIISSGAYASCFTGFACSIESLEQEEYKKTAEYMEIIDKYFSKEPLEKDYAKGKILINNYNDIFLFKTIV